MRISDLSSDVCSSDLHARFPQPWSTTRMSTLTRASRSSRSINHCLLYSLSAVLTTCICSGGPHSTTNPSRSEEHTSELQSLMRISYAVFCLTKKKRHIQQSHTTTSTKTNTERQHQRK